MTTTCIEIPGTPAVPYTPARVDVDANLGWNAGARSIAQYSGPCRLQFTMPQVVGAVCGLATRHRGTDPAGIDFAFQFETSALGAVFRAIEAGRAVSEWATYTPGTTVFRIDRHRDGQMIAQAGAVTVAVAAARVLDPLITVGCLFAASDQIG